ncbi:MAG TPA: glycerol-3-phosphate 1-O-acyltransferase PlsY [Candidatus Sulfotelmatobacter sp.]|nr:glycerol-3-phosphate 1-O-acyltransferase PlsY [Candidatus Sulfotelmatobacter sp.]
MPRFLLIAAASYLLGSIPFGYLLVRIFRGEDVRLSGSGNIGATNVSRKSPALGVLTLLLDALKGSAAVAVGVILSPPFFERIPISQIPWRTILPASSPGFVTWAATGALFAVVGHMFPVWLKFRGGKGVATGLGGFLMIAPQAVLLSAGIFLVVVLLFRYVSLGSITAVAAFPNLALLLHEYGNVPLALALMSLASVLIVVQHRANIRRLLAGTENRLGSKSASGRQA